jgi:tetratricopeptide (TPR) repeat protein
MYQQNPKSPASMMPPMRYFNSVSGSVLGDNDQPLYNVQVELRDSTTGMIVNSVTTGRAGDFEFRQVPQGVYKVVAVSGLEEAEERVDVNNLNAPINLRLRGNKAPNNSGSSTVSVAQYKVPEKAREEFMKARDASVKGKLDEAQAHLTKALDLYPNYADGLTLRAILKLSAGETDSAVADLERAIQCDANYAMAYMVLGSAFNIKARFDEAITALQRGESLSPGSWQAYFELGKAYAGKNDYEASLQQLDRAQTLAPPDYPLIRLVRAHVFMQLHRYADAITDLETFLHKNPSGMDTELAQRMLESAKASMAEQK